MNLLQQSKQPLHKPTVFQCGIVLHLNPLLNPKSHQISGIPALLQAQAKLMIIKGITPLSLKQPQT